MSRDERGAWCGEVVRARFLWCYTASFGRSRGASSQPPRRSTSHDRMRRSAPPVVVCPLAQHTDASGNATSLPVSLRSTHDDVADRPGGPIEGVGLPEWARGLGERSGGRRTATSPRRVVPGFDGCGRSWPPGTLIESTPRSGTRDTAESRALAAPPQSSHHQRCLQPIDIARPSAG